MAVTNISRRTMVGGIMATAAVAPFAPALAAHRPLSFLAMGDWGRDGNQHQRDVAVQMGKAASDLGSRFILAVGDNFYPNGVKTADDAQWKTSFEDVYTAPSLQVPWHVALGNHDYHGEPQAQIDYAAKSRRWHLPSRYYTLPGAALGTPELDMFVMDTTPFVLKYARKPGAQASNVDAQDVGAQLAWLDRALGSSTARWKIVVGHHTIMSGGSEHGPTPELVASVKPLLERHGVQAYINGHDHDMQHIRAGGVDYICCGAGSEVRPTAPVEGTLFCLARSGFASLTLDGDALGVEFRDYTGASVYRGSVPVGATKAAA